MATATMNGRVSQVIGSTFDAEFDEGHLPNIYNALKVEGDVKGVKINLTGEVQQHLGGNRVRCVALGSTEGLVRGMPVIDTGNPVSVPVGKEALGRVFNLLGDPIDGRGPVNAEERWPIHREPPDRSRASRPRPSSSRRGSRSSTCSRRSSAAARSASSAAPGWARRSS